MMLAFNSCALNIKQARIDLAEFDALLKSKMDIGEKSLQQLFQTSEQLPWLLGKATGIDAPDKFNAETSIFSKYRTDFVITNSTGDQLSLIEFEEAKSDSIFKEKKNKASTRYDWSNTLEHGFSQVSDWFYMLGQKHGSEEMENEFGSRKIQYQGGVVAGRDSGISSAEQKNRLKWRIDNTVINSKHILFFTFDSLYEAMTCQLDIIESYGIVA